MPEGFTLAIKSKDEIVTLVFILKASYKICKATNHSAWFAISVFKSAHGVVEPKKEAKSVNNRKCFHFYPLCNFMKFRQKIG